MRCHLDRYIKIGNKFIQTQEANQCNICSKKKECFANQFFKCTIRKEGLWRDNIFEFNQ